MFTVEYADKTEIIFRLVGVFCGSVLLYLYTGWILTPVAWTLSYFVTHAAHFVFLQSRMRRATMKDAHIAGALVYANFAAFAWLPTTLATISDDPGLSYAGLTLIVALTAFLIKRADTLPWMIAAEIFMIWAMFFCVLAALLGEITSMTAKFASVLVSVVVVAYLSKTLTAARHHRLAAEEAAKRNAHENKMAAIGQLAGGVAHDFNNALTVIMGNLELHDLLEDEDEKRQVLREAAASATRAKETVRQLLIFAHKAPAFLRPLHVPDAVAELAQLSKRLMPEHIQLRTRYCSGLPPVLLDETQLLTVMINLTTNACDAMPNGGSLTVHCGMVALSEPLQMADGVLLPPAAYVRISFADTGHGIPQAILERVTEPFFTTKEPGKGTGLGLSMAQSFARDSGGGLTIDSSREGTEVALYLPPHRTPTEAPQVVRQRAPKTEYQPIATTRAQFQ